MQAGDQVSLNMAVNYQMDQQWIAELLKNQSCAVNISVDCMNSHA